MSRQRIRHFAVALSLSVIVTAASAMPAVARIAAPSKASSLSSTAAPAQAVVGMVAPHTSREIFGFALASSLADPTVGYPSWNFNLLSTVAVFGVHVDTAGRFVADSGLTVWNSSALTGLVTTAHQHGVKVLLTIVLQDFSANTPNMCAGLANADATVAETVSEVNAKGVDGVNIDYEGLDGGCGTGDPYWAQHAMTNFTAKMRSALGSSSYLSVDTYSGSATDPYGFFDVTGLSAYVDSMFVMAYDMEYSNYSGAPLYCSSFCLGPTSPLTSYRYNDADVMAAYIAVAPASKVILGVPYYGRKACVGGLGPNQYPTSSVVADSYLDASGEAAYYEVKPGSYAIHREANSSGMERWDTWFNTTLSCTRELYWDDAVSLGKKYDLANADGLRGIGIWNLNYGGGAPELWAALQSHFASCNHAAVTVSPASPQLPGAQVQFTASSSGCPNPLYQYWILAPGSSTWQVAQAYSTGATFSWNTSGKIAGTYLISLWVRDSASPGTTSNSLGSFDTFVGGTAYKLTPTQCTSVTDSAAPASPSPAGTAITFTAVAAGCPNPRYQFWILAPGSSAWTVLQAYSTSATYAWNTAGKTGGTYRISVWARDASSAGSSSNTLGSFDAFAPGAAYALNLPCASAKLTSSPPATAAAGTAVTFTATASGCPNPLYQFWVLAPSSTTWQVAQAYSSSASFSWSTSGKPAGGYLISVWARDSGSPGTTSNSLGSFDAFVGGTAYALTPTLCTSVTDSATPAAPSAAGTAVTFTAIAAGCPNPRYQFWILAPGSSTWTVAQAYSTTATFTWNTAGKAGGTYRISVWARDASSSGSTSNSLGSFDAFAPGAPYALNSPCATASFTSSPASTAAAGATVTFTAVSTGCANPLYEFWVLAPGSSTWQPAQTYSASATFAWNTSGRPAGTYHVSVWVRDSSSSGTTTTSLGSFDTFVGGTAYTLT
jgi:spore germination protein YaaH